MKLLVVALLSLFFTLACSVTSETVEIPSDSSNNKSESATKAIETRQPTFTAKTQDESEGRQQIIADSGNAPSDTNAISQPTPISTPVMDRPVSITSKSPDQKSPSKNDVLENAIKSVVMIKTPVGGGSGFFISQSGTILTNYHVVEGYEDVIIDYAGKTIDGTVTGWDQGIDIAIVEVNLDKDDISYLPPKTYQTLLGEEVFSLGFPRYEGLDPAFVLTKGIISSFRTIQQIKYIQTDAPLNPGSSGGPLVNGEGDLLGVTTAKLENTEVGQQIEGVGFVLELKEIIPRLNSLIIEGVRLTHPSWCPRVAEPELAPWTQADWGTVYEHWVRDVYGGNPLYYQYLYDLGLNEDPLKRGMQARFLIDGKFPIVPNDPWFDGQNPDPLETTGCPNSSSPDNLNPYLAFLEQPRKEMDAIGKIYLDILVALDNPNENLDPSDDESLKKARWRNRFLFSDSASQAQAQLVALIILRVQPETLRDETANILARIYSDWLYRGNTGDGNWLQVAKDHNFFGLAANPIFDTEK